MPEKFKLGDLVWAKMKGYRPWPGRIAKPTADLKKSGGSKRGGVQCIYFYGSKNYAWIDDINITPYEENKELLTNSSKAAAFKQALEDIEDYIKKKEEDPSFDPDKTLQEDATFDKLKEGSPPKKKKEGAVKRQAISTPKTALAKKKRLSPEANGASPSYSNNLVRNYNEILNRPTVMELTEAPAVDLNDVSSILKSKNVVASKLTFGFLGLGIMGSGIVKNLINSGHKVNIWSRTIQKAEDIKSQADLSAPGLVECYPTPCDIANNSDIIFCCVSDPRAVKDIVDGNCGILDEMDSLDGKGYVEMTNVDSASSIEISKLITNKGGRYLEAQLQGSKEEADEGNLIVLGAGDKGLYDDCYTCFRAIGKTVFYLGEVGFASKMNLVLQVMRGVALVGVAEGLALADRSGLAPKDVLEVFDLTSLCSPYLKTKADLITKLQFHDVAQPLQHMQKDLKLALQLADSLKQPLLMASTANEVYKHVRRLGYDTYDAAAVYMRTRH